MVEHICQIVFSEGRRKRYAKEALETLLSLIKKSVDAVQNYERIFDPEKTAWIDGPKKAGIDDLLKGVAWIDNLLKRAARKHMDDETFTVLLRLNALRRSDEAATGPETTGGHDFDHFEGNEADPEGVVKWGDPTPEYALLDKVLRIVDICGAQDDWEDDAVYGGLIAIKDLPGPELGDPKEEFIRTLAKAMEKRETEGEEFKKDKPFRVKKAAYDVVLSLRDRWLRSADLRQTFEAVDFPRKLHSVIAETFRSDYQRSFLEMIEILSEDRYWHPYLRKAMDIWLPLHRDGPDHALRTLRSVGELLPGGDRSNKKKSLEKVVEEEWEAVPGRSDLNNLTADRLGPLAEVTEQFKRLSVFSESGREAVLAAVEQVVPCLERRRDEGYGGPDDELRMIIEDLLRVLREPVQADSSQPTFW